jgi:hypothetical protein
VQFDYIGGFIMSMTEARIKANAKYNAKTYKQLNAHIKIEEYERIEKYCNETGISKAQLILKSIKYCIENNIDLN